MWPQPVCRCGWVYTAVRVYVVLRAVDVVVVVEVRFRVIVAGPAWLLRKKMKR